MTVDVKDQKNTNRRRGRPRKDINAGKDSRSRRPNRTPIHEQRSKLEIVGLPEGYRGKWVRDTGESGQKISSHILAGWNFCKKEDVSVGESWVFESQHVGGSIIRRPAGGADGDYLYLMMIPEEYYLEDEAVMYDEIDKQEHEMLYGVTEGSNEDDDGTNYGGTNITRNLKDRNKVVKRR